MRKIILIILSGLFFLGNIVFAQEGTRQPAIKDNIAGWNYAKKLYGIDRKTYFYIISQKEKTPQYYRNFLKKQPFMWGVNDVGDSRSLIFKEGIWIYPYLVEQIGDAKKARQIIYPPGEDAFNQSGAILGTQGNFSRLYAQIIYRLYIDRQLPDSLMDIPVIAPLAEKDAEQEKNRLLKAYCQKFSASLYCKASQEQ